MAEVTRILQAIDQGDAHGAEGRCSTDAGRGRHTLYSSVRIIDDTTTVHGLKSPVGAFSEARDWDHFHSGNDLAIGIISRGETASCWSRPTMMAVL